MNDTTPPDAVKTTFEEKTTAARQEIIWTVIEDVQDSYTLAMTHAGIDPAIVEEVTGTVTDYVANNWGDD